MRLLYTCSCLSATSTCRFSNIHISPIWPRSTKKAPPNSQSHHHLINPPEPGPKYRTPQHPSSPPSTCIPKVPGYCGFIPSSKINTRAREHADMINPRPKCLDLRLFYSHNIPGYTGHAPAAARNDRGPARCGSNTLTTSGAAALGFLV